MFVLANPLISITHHLNVCYEENGVQSYGPLISLFSKISAEQMLEEINKMSPENIEILSTEMTVPFRNYFDQIAEMNECYRSKDELRLAQKLYQMGILVKEPQEEVSGYSLPNYPPPKSYGCPII